MLGDYMCGYNFRIVLDSTLTFVLCVQTLEQEEKDNEAVSKMMALEQKNQLPNLFQDKNRPTLTKWPQVRLDSNAWCRCYFESTNVLVWSVMK